MPAPKQHPIRGYLYIATATFCWGVSAAVGKAVFTGRLLSGVGGRAIDPLVLSQARVTWAFIVLGPTLLLLRGWRGLAMPRGDLIRSLLIGAAGISVSNYFYYVAIEKTTIAVAITLQYLSPILVLVAMVARRKQRATLLRVGSVCLAVVGSALAIGLGRSNFNLNPVGVAAGLGAAFGFSFYTVVGSDLVVRRDRWLVFMYSMLGSSVFWATINPPWRIAHLYNAQQWGFLVAFATFSVLIAYSLYYAGMQQLDATRSIVTSCLEPVFSITIAATTLGEAITWLQGVGVAVVLAATILIQKPERVPVESQRAATGGRSPVES